MSKQAKRRSRSYWTKLVGEYERRAGRETQESFAQRKRIKVDTFRSWLYKMRRERNGQPVRFVEVKANGTASNDQDVEIDLGSGRVTVRFARVTDANRIGDVVVALAARLDC